MSSLEEQCHIDKGTYTDGPVRTAEVRELFKRIAELEKVASYSLLKQNEKLKAENAKLREFTQWCADLESARSLWGGMSDRDWFDAIEEKARQALKQSSDTAGGE